MMGVGGWEKRGGWIGEDGGKRIGTNAENRAPLSRIIAFAVPFFMKRCLSLRECRYRKQVQMVLKRFSWINDVFLLCTPFPDA